MEVYMEVYIEVYDILYGVVFKRAVVYNNETMIKRI
jgi:hypothetical protein